MMGVALAHFVRLANIMISWPEQIAKIVNFRNLIQIRDPRILVHAFVPPGAISTPTLDSCHMLCK